MARGSVEARTDLCFTLQSSLCMIGRISENAMHRFMLFVGMGTALAAANSCSRGPALPLALVATRNAADTIRAMLERGYAADQRDDHGLTPLMWAARTGATEAMAALLDGGADPDARDSSTQWTPLLHAIHRQQPAAVRLLLERGADANAAAPRNVTPLMMAADDRDPTNIRLLLAYGADPNVLGPGGRTALTQAVSGGALTDFTDRPLLGGCRLSAVRALIEHDPSLRLPDNFAGRQALWWARFHGCDDVLELVGGSRVARHAESPR